MALRDYPDFQEAELGLGATLLSLDKVAEALPHLQRAVELSPDDEVGWYRLAQVQRKLGNTDEQRRDLAEYRRLHEKIRPETGMQELFSPPDVTKQQVEPKDKQ